MPYLHRILYDRSQGSQLPSSRPHDLLLQLASSYAGGASPACYVRARCWPRGAATRSGVQHLQPHRLFNAYITLSRLLTAQRTLPYFVTSLALGARYRRPPTERRTISGQVRCVRCWPLSRRSTTDQPAPWRRESLMQHGETLMMLLWRKSPPRRNAGRRRQLQRHYSSLHACATNPPCARPWSPCLGTTVGPR